MNFIFNRKYCRYFDGDLQKSYLVLEDLTVANYINVARSQGLNYHQLEISLKTLALWHAASIKIVNDVSIIIIA